MDSRIKRKANPVNVCFYVPYVTKACCIAVAIFSALYSLPSFGKTNSLVYSKLSADEMTQIYDKMEAELLLRFDIQKEKKSRHLSETIEALGHIRSCAGAGKLIADIDIQPENYEARVGSFYSITPSNSSSIQGMYVAFRVLENSNILPIERIIQEAEAAVPGTKRETLLILLGYSCYGDAFADYAKDRKKTNSSATDWEGIYQCYRGYMLQRERMLTPGKRQLKPAKVENKRVLQ